jgi:hypothetical protein
VQQRDGVVMVELDAVEEWIDVLDLYCRNCPSRFGWNENGLSIGRRGIAVHCFVSSDDTMRIIRMRAVTSLQHNMSE